MYVAIAHGALAAFVEMKHDATILKQADEEKCIQKETALLSELKSKFSELKSRCICIVSSSSHDITILQTSSSSSDPSLSGYLRRQQSIHQSSTQKRK